MQVTTGRLAVPGSTLHYEVRGRGPALLLIPSGNGDGTPLVPLAEAMAGEYTVITYDRRGFSRSPLDGPVGDDRIADDAHDIGALLDHIADGPAAVFGSSSGAIVAIAALERHHDAIRTVVVHEPPLASVLPDAAEWLAFYRRIHTIYLESGVDEARKAFREGMGMAATTRASRKTELPPDQLEEMLARIRRNYVFWFEHELLPYPAYQPDLVLLKSLAGKLILAGGDESRDGFPYRPNTVLAGHTGNEIVHLPGGHVGYVTHPEEFAAAFRELIRA